MTTGRIYDHENTSGPPWKLDRATYKDLYQRVTQGTTTKLQRCRHYVITRSRILYGVTSITPENRKAMSLFSLWTGPETSAAFGWVGGGRKFICTLDDLGITDHKTGEALHQQQWEHYSKWADVPDSDFGTTDDVDEGNDGSSGGEGSGSSPEPGSGGNDLL